MKLTRKGMFAEYVARYVCIAEIEEYFASKHGTFLTDDRKKSLDEFCKKHTNCADCIYEWAEEDL